MWVTGNKSQFETNEVNKKVYLRKRSSTFTDTKSKSLKLKQTSSFPVDEKPDLKMLNSSNISIFKIDDAIIDKEMF